MKITIFYSWQSTTIGKYNRYFIKDCIEDAKKQIKKLPDFKSIDIEIQEGIAGESGSVAVASSITDKRIPDCDIFIADLSVINWVSKWKKYLKNIIGDKYKPHQNNNVILEYGVAMNSVGLERIIGILNSKYGSPNETPDNIPFDIRHLRFPIEYCYSSKNENKKSEIKKQLISDIANALKTTIPLVLQTQKSKFYPFVAWNAWNEKLKNPQVDFFIENNKIQEIKTTILDAINDSNNPDSIRLLGLSGLGKTRILLETFRTQENNINSQSFSNRVLYVNCNDYLNQINFTDILAKIAREKSDAILIVDNCDLNTHRLISRNLSGLSFISIDSNPEEFYSNRVKDTSYIIIKKDEFFDIVEKIIDRDFKGLEKDKIELIKQFSQGIPLMAVLLGESVRDGEQPIGKINDKDLLDKLLGEKGRQAGWRTILKSCSLFDYFGYLDEYSVQYEFIATNGSITVSDCSSQVRIQTFREVVNHYRNREIFEKRGRFLSVRPFPLALYLAEEWLETCNPERLLNVITDIANLEEPHRTSLTESFAKQMKYLEYNDNAKLIVEKIIGINSPFDNAEVLNTELGSRLFRSFAEVNPVAVSQNFRRQFLNKTTEELLKIEAGRRNIVWALEKLCFYKDTFHESAKVLYAFAVAENESWGNNATGQLRQLFHIFLSGTEANLKERWSIIEWGLSINDELFTKLAIELMKSGLNARYFSRTMGAEQRGTKKFQDYNPSVSEIKEYWNNILSKLTEIIGLNNQYSDVAGEIVADSIRPIFNFGFPETVIFYLEKIIVIKSNDWDKGLENLKMTIHYDKNRMSNNSIEAIQKLIKSLTKTDFISRFFASTHYEDVDVKWSSEKFMQREQSRMENLAKEFIDTNISLDEILPVLYKRDDNKYLMYKSEFGKKVYEYISGDADKVNLFIDKSLQVLIELGEENIDFLILLGFIQNAKGSVKDRFYSLLYQSEELHSLIFNFVSFDEDGVKQFDKLFTLVETNKCEVTDFSLFRYRIVLQNLNKEELLSFKEKLFTYGDNGYVIVFNLLSSIQGEKNTDEQLFLRDSLKECVLKLGVDYRNSRHIYEYEYSKFITDILSSNYDDEFAIFITNSIIHSISWKNNYHLNHYIQDICEILMKKYFKSTWPIFSQGFLGEDDDYVEFWGLKHIFGSNIGGVGRSASLLLDGDIEEIFKWCHENRPVAPIRIAGLLPIYKNNNQDFTQWNPITKRLIDEFGDIQEVLDELSCNMGCFSWTGSIVPLLQSRVELYESITSHPIPRVAEWARKNLQYTEKEIENEKNRDVETFL